MGVGARRVAGIGGSWAGLAWEEEGGAFSGVLSRGLRPGGGSKRPWPRGASSQSEAPPGAIRMAEQIQSVRPGPSSPLLLRLSEIKRPTQLRRTNEPLISAL